MHGERVLSRAFVLRVTEYGESDKIVTFFSEAHGRISAIAKGARRSRKRFVNKLEPFTLLEPEIIKQRKTTLGILQDAELLSSFPSLRTHYQRYLAASLVTEIMLSWTRDHDADSHLFALLSWCLHELCDAEETATPLLFFLVRMAAIQGFMPHFADCRLCGNDISGNGPLLFATTTGGVVCGRCEGHHTGTRLLPGTAKLLQKAMTLPRQSLSRLKLSPRFAPSALAAMIDYHHSLLQREFSSWPLLQRSLSGSTAKIRG